MSKKIRGLGSYSKFSLQKAYIKGYKKGTKDTLKSYEKSIKKVFQKK